MFTDLVNSTAMTTSLGPTAAMELTEWHLSALRDSLAVHRGTEIKAIGDGIMATFSSAADGIGCAVTMQRAIVRHNRRHPDRLLEVRIGLSHGDATPVEGDWFGIPCIEAARLCAACNGGEIYLSDVLRIVARDHAMHRLVEIGELALKGLEPIQTWTVDWDREEEFALHVAIADDSAVLRQGVAMALESAGMKVVLQTSDAESLLNSIEGAMPHVVLLDVRMPPTHTTEGLDAAEIIRERHPDIGILMMSASVDAAAARRLLANVTHGMGYLLKDRIADMDELATAIRTVASGGSAIDPEVLDLLRPTLTS